MYRYGGDMSTSSEDDTSTAAGAASTPTTADICRSVVRNGAKVLKCIGCGYTSDRRMNVTRHYRRIHTQLKKLRECPCGEMFQTKWEFYEHCDENHPAIRQSWYTTTHVYKLQQTKAKSKRKSVSKPGERVVALSREPTREGMATRASIRLRNREIFKSTSNDSSTPGCSSTEEVPSISSTESFSTSCSSVEEVPLISSTESFSTSCNSENDSPLKKTQQPLDSCKSSDTNDENTVPRIGYEISHLPIKKRYSSKRRYFKDITNKNVEVQRIRRCNDSNNNARISFRELYLSKIDEKQRAYISNIDFDELDAILKLRDMKRSFI